MRSAILVLTVIIFGLSATGCYSEAQRKARSNEALEAAVQLAKDQKYPEAQAKAEEALRENALNLSAYQMLGSLYLAENKLDEAENTFLKGIAIMPTNAQFYNSLGIVALKKGEVQKAIDNFSQAISNDPTMAIAYVNLADVSMASGQTELALNLYQRAMAVDPNSQEAKQKLSALIALAKQQTEAPKTPNMPAAEAATETAR